MIATRPDWCISRQRVWGVPIIVFYCEACQRAVHDRKVLDRVVALFAKHTADVWYSSTARRTDGPGPCVRAMRRHGISQRDRHSRRLVRFRLEPPGRSHAGERPALARRHVSRRRRSVSRLVPQLAADRRRAEGRSALPRVRHHGWTLDEQGRAMSKSLGNSIEPEEIISKNGADVLRLWVASVDFTEDVRMSELILDRLSEAYRKLRNTFRWMLGNLHDFDPQREGVPGEELAGVDAWILVRAEELVKRCLDYYSQFAFHKVYRAVYDFATTDLSAMYFDVAKDRLYTAGPDSIARRSAQTALYRLNLALVRLLAPILSFHLRRGVEEHEAGRLRHGERSSCLLPGGGGIDGGSAGGAARGSARLGDAGTRARPGIEGIGCGARRQSDRLVSGRGGHAAGGWRTICAAREAPDRSSRLVYCFASRAATRAG